MARILFTANPASGHIRPGLPIARELVARGHEVAWYTSERFADLVERTGARHVGQQTSNRNGRPGHRRSRS
jgi:UDP:flavonoid glycosyltransferase YjiC (YdhE family)